MPTSPKRSKVLVVGLKVMFDVVDDPTQTMGLTMHGYVIFSEGKVIVSGKPNVSTAQIGAAAGGMVGYLIASAIEGPNKSTDHQIDPKTSEAFVDPSGAATLSLADDKWLAIALNPRNASTSQQLVTAAQSVFGQRCQIMPLGAMSPKLKIRLFVAGLIMALMMITLFYLASRSH